VNANPLTGVPAVLGELAGSSEHLDTYAVSWNKLRTVPLSTLIDQQPVVYQKIVQLAQNRKVPTQFLIYFSNHELEVLKEESLTLSTACVSRFFFELLQANDIGDEQFLRSIPPEAVTQRHARLDPRHNPQLTLVAQGTAISGGPAKGILGRDQDISRSSSGNSAGHIVLVDRIEAQHTTLLNEPSCVGVVALRGSPADHFALLAREKGFPYMVLDMHSMNDSGLCCRNKILPFGTFLTVDFSAGHVYLGDGVIGWEQDDPAIATAKQLLTTQASPIPLWLNIDTADDMGEGLPADASGIGLLRTEHMLRRGGMDEVLRQFMEPNSVQTRKEALAELVSFFHKEFTRCFTVAKGRPITFRLLDYPLHELGGGLAREVNPMLGLRGVRQGIQWPALYVTQIEAILHAAASARDQGTPVHDVGVMIPLVSFAEEVHEIRRWVEQCQNAHVRHQDLVINVGAMIETPAAALRADVLAQACDFLSFGTNDLTQLCLGLSREDYLAMFHSYRHHNLLQHDPFGLFHPVVLQLVRDAAARVKHTCPSTMVGLCGAHAADPQALELCKLGLLDYLSLPQQLLPRVKLQAIQMLDRYPDAGRSR
jgi:pyruvate,orthophosphate dikinase